MSLVYPLFTNVGHVATSDEVTVGGNSVAVFHAQCPAAFEVEIQAYNIASTSWQTLPLIDESTNAVARIFGSGVYTAKVYQHAKIRAKILSADGIVTLSCFIIDQFASDHSVVHVDGRHLDAFGRIRTSTPVTLFDSQNTSGSQPLLWENSTTGGATVTYTANRSSVSLATATVSGDLAIRQTRQYFRYQSGKSQNILITSVIGVAVTNTTKRWGYFDVNNGLFFEQDGDGLYVVKRSFVSGSAVDTRVSQSSWNIDRMDGTGASGITLDITKSQIFSMDFEWLGVGSVRFGVYIDGTFYPCHLMRHSNVLGSVYMSSPNLPLRYEVRNTDTSAGGSLEQICTSVMSEAGFEEERGFLFSASAPVGGTSVSQLARTSIVAIRLATNIYGLSNRTTIIPTSISTISTQTAKVELVYNPTMTSGSVVWQKIDGHSGVEFTRSAASVNDGIPITTEYIGTSGATPQRISQDVSSRLPITRDINEANPIVLALVVTPTQNATIDGSINWKELY